MSIIDLRARPPVVVGQVEAGAGAAGISVTRDGRLVLVANRNEGTVSVFRIEDRTLRKLDTVVLSGPESGPSHVAIAPDGRSALVTRDGDHTVSLLAIDAEKVTYAHQDLGAGLKPYGVVITPDGQEAVVANLGLGRGDNDTISLIDLTLKPPRTVETYTVGQTPEGIAISPDGRLVAVVIMNGSNKPKESPFYSPVGRVVLYRLNRGSLTRVADAAVGAWPQGAAFSADGRTLLVQSMSERSIAVFAIEPGFALRDTGQRILLPSGGAALRTASRPRGAASSSTSLLQLRIRSRGEEHVLDPLHQRAVLLGFRAGCQPLGVGREGVPFLFTLGQALPLQQVVQRVVGRTHQRRPESDLADPELVPHLQRDVGEAVVEIRHAAGDGVIDAQLVNHALLLLW